MVRRGLRRSSTTLLDAEQHGIFSAWVRASSKDEVRIGINTGYEPWLRDQGAVAGQGTARGDTSRPVRHSERGLWILIRHYALPSLKSRTVSIGLPAGCFTQYAYRAFPICMTRLRISP